MITQTPGLIYAIEANQELVRFRVRDSLGYGPVRHMAAREFTFFLCGYAKRPVTIKGFETYKELADA